MLESAPHWLPWAAAAVVALAGGAFRGFSGFGSGLLMAPLITIVFPAPVAVPVLIMLGFSGSFWLVPDVWGKFDWKRVAAIGLPAMATVPIGVWLLSWLEPEIVRRAVSALVLLMAAALATGLRFELRRPLAAWIATGSVSGVLTGIGGVGGPPVVLALLSTDKDPQATRGDLIIFFAMSQIAALTAMGIKGMLSGPVWPLYLCMAPPFFLAIAAGARAFKNERSRTHYRRAALAVLALSAVIGLASPSL